MEQCSYGVLCYCCCSCCSNQGACKSSWPEERTKDLVSRAHAWHGVVTPPRHPLHLPRARLSGRQWDRRNRPDPRVILTAHPPRPGFGGGLSHVPTTATDPGPPIYAARAGPTGTRVDLPVGLRRRAGDGVRLVCAVAGGAGDPVWKDEEGIRWGWGPVRGVRCFVGQGEGDGSRARPMGARQLTARVAVGGSRFPIGLLSRVAQQ